MWVGKSIPGKNSLLRGYTHIEQLQRHIAVLLGGLLWFLL